MEVWLETLATLSRDRGHSAPSADQEKLAEGGFGSVTLLLMFPSFTSLTYLLSCSRAVLRNTSVLPLWAPALTEWRQLGSKYPRGLQQQELLNKSFHHRPRFLVCRQLWWWQRILLKRSAHFHSSAMQEGTPAQWTEVQGCRENVKEFPHEVTVQPTQSADSERPESGQ